MSLHSIAASLKNAARHEPGRVFTETLAKKSKLSVQWKDGAYCLTVERKGKYPQANTPASGKWLDELRTFKRYFDIPKEHKEEQDAQPTYYTATFTWNESQTFGSEQLHDLLSLIGYDISVEVIESWNEAEVAQVETWASAVHLRANDHTVREPPIPACVVVVTPGEKFINAWAARLPPGIHITNRDFREQIENGT